MSASSNSELSFKIVIIGLSFAGIAAGNALDKALAKSKYAGKVSVTIVEPRNGFHYGIATPRALSNKKFAEALYLPFDNAFKKSKSITIKQSRVSNVFPGHVTCENGDKVEYDYLIVASGAQYSHPFKTQATTKEIFETAFNQSFEAVKAAKEILVVGGGVLGCETAGDLKEAYPDKKVTLLHGGKHLVDNNFTEKDGARVAKKLKALGVEIILGELATDIGELRKVGLGTTRSTITTDKGTKIEADVQILCSGNGTPSTGFMSSLGEGLLDERGFVKVTPTLQLSTFPNVFVAGDANNLAFNKTAVNAKSQGGNAAEAIIKIIDAGLKANTKLSSDEIKKLTFAPFRPMLSGLAVTIGHSGVGNFFLGDLAAWIKGKDFFIKNAYSDLNLKAPAL